MSAEGTAQPVKTAKRSRPPARQRSAPSAPQPRALRDIVTDQVAALCAYHQTTCESDAPEGIHKMRVTTRRLQASLDLLQSGDSVKAIRKLKRRLRKWRRKLSQVRNYDVFLELIEKEAAHLRPLQKERFELLRGVLRERRAAIATEVTVYLETLKVRVIANRLGLPADAGQAGAGESAPTSGDESVADRLFAEPLIAARAAERIEQRLAEFLELAAQSQPTTNPTELHQLRIAAKRLRYLFEIVAEMGFGPAKGALSWLRSLQDRIGDWHDLESIEEEIIALAIHHDFVKAHLAETAQMLQAAAHLQNKKVRLVARLFPVKPPPTIVTAAQRFIKALRCKAEWQNQKAAPAPAETA